ncbi:Cupredoxin [Salicola sp. Rm-C-2C1-2]|uniref:Cupredoxin n=1 Tax=Salicola sp. Rm-C-2C1-2 TaxID=3141321 RepID=UPI0032E3DCA2
MPAIASSLPRLAGLSALLLSLCAAADTLTITVEAKQSGKPISDAVVTIPGSGAPPPGKYTIAQNGRAFQPQVLTVPVGSEINFPNKDDTQHHVYSFSPAKTFDIELYAGKPESPIHFDKPGIVELGCNIHDHMQGFVIVTKRPHYGRTDKNGQVRFEHSAFPEGQPITARVWHPQLKDTTQFRKAAVTRETTRVTLALRPEPAPDEELDQLQQEFNNL